MDKIFYICLGIWAFLTGIILVTNLEVAWSQPLTGFAALVVGVICIIRALK